MSKIKAAVFDVDGTLLNTKEGILSSIRATLEEMGYDDIPEDKIYMFVGPPIQRSMMEVYGCTKEEAQDFANHFRQRYSKPEYLFQAERYDGIIELMKELSEKGIKIAVATYKREDYAIDIVKKFGITDYADVVHGADNFNKLTKADIIKLCIDEMGLEPSECVMVGDSDNDAIGAKGMGCPFIGVTYGFGFTCDEDVMEFDNIGVAHSAEEIINFVL